MNCCSNSRREKEKQDSRMKIVVATAGERRRNRIAEKELFEQQQKNNKGEDELVEQQQKSMISEEELLKQQQVSQVAEGEQHRKNENSRIKCGERIRRNRITERERLEEPVHRRQEEKRDTRRRTWSNSKRQNEKQDN